MISFLTSRLGMLIVGSVVGAGVLGGAWWYVTSLQDDNERLRAKNATLAGQIEQVQAVNAENVAEIDRLKSANAIADETAADAREREAEIDTILLTTERIRNETVAEGGDAPAAPVLINSADGVRRITGTGGAGGGAGAGGDTPD